MNDNTYKAISLLTLGLLALGNYLNSIMPYAYNGDYWYTPTINVVAVYVGLATIAAIVIFGDQLEARRGEEEEKP
jgi:Ni/Fe-hydrogenase subunit HybB-like protein